MTTEAHQNSGEDRQIVLDEPAQTPLAQWLATSSGALDSEDEGQWAAPLRRFRASATIWAVAGGALVAVLTAMAMAMTTVLAGTDNADSTVAVPISITEALPPWPGDGRDHSTTVTGSSAAACGSGTLEAATLVSGPRPLRAATGAQAIAVFEAAYYHARDGAIARDVVATGAAVSDAATIQAGIDSVPPVAAFCARIEPLTPGLYAVQITETRPATPSRVWRQRISTAHHGGHSVITAIASE